MKILMYDPRHFSEYGAQQSMLTLAKGLKDKGHIPVIVTGKEGSLINKAKEFDLEYYVCPIFKEIDLFDGKALETSYFEKLKIGNYILKYNYKLYKYAKNNNFDFLYANSLRGVLYLGISKMFLKKPLLWYIRGGYSYRFLSAYASLISDQIFLISKASIKAVPKWLQNRVEKKTNLNHIGLDISKYTNINDKSLSYINAQREKFNLPEDKTIITSIGSISPRKGFDVLLSSFKTICEEHNNTILVIAGTANNPSHKKYKEELLDFVDKNNLPVIFLGWVDDVSSLLNASDIFVLASREEGLGRVNLEAMASGIAPIVTRAGGSEDTVIDNKTGFIVEPENKIQLSNKIEFLLDNEGPRIKMGKKARKRCENKFSIDNYVNRFEEVLSNSL